MGYTLKGRDVIKLEAIAKKLGKSYSECFAEIVGRTHEQMFGAAEGQTETDPSGDSSAKAKADAALREDGEPDDGDGFDTRETEHQDAPVMKGSKPNPLAIKRWADAAAPDDDEDDDEEEPQKKPAPAAQKATLGGERWRALEKQRRVATHGRSQR